MKAKHTILNTNCVRMGLLILFALFPLRSASSLYGQAVTGPVRITLDEAIQMALQHNHNMIAARTAIEQSQAMEVTANLRPNPTLFVDWDYLPLGSPAHQNPDLYPGVSTGDYLRNNTEGDIGLSYLIERGKKRERRHQAAKDVTAQTRSLVADNERGLSFQVATLFTNVQLAESAIDLAQQDLKSFQKTVDIGEFQFKAGGISESNYLMIEVQLLQFQTDLESAQLGREQGLSDLRQLLGYESVSADYDVVEAFDYLPMKANLDDLKMQALQNRPDLRAAVQGVTAANSGYLLAKADGVQDLTVQGNYSHVNGINAITLYASIPLPIFNRNQGEIARTHSVITQMEEQQKFTSGQALTDVMDAYEGLKSDDRVILLYRDKYRDIAKKSRDIADYAYHAGGLALLDFLDAERTYRAAELGYRQALADYLLALEQLREAVGTRNLP
ncbi:MAG TPA: TolC family protein [Candidatus Acidoferrum sp.]|nr:TolC family protein [Candidatus Acidoferrum sp.]